MSSRWTVYLLLVILGLAFGLRVWGIRFGLPYDLTYDEIHEIVRAFKLGAGEYDWQGFGKGGLYYFLFVEYALLYVVWRVMGWIADSHDFAMRYFQDPSAFYLAGRLTVALMGTLTCWVVYGIGRRLYDRWVGIGVALIGATAYYHAIWSHYINVDIGMTLALWTSILAYLQYESTSKLRWLLAAGVCGGIAIAFKLPGAIVLPVLLIAIALPEGWHHPLKMFKESIVVSVTLLVALTIVAPEWLANLIDLSHFLNWFGEGATSAVTPSNEMRQNIDAVTIYRGKDWLGYVYILFAPQNAILTVSALFGAGLALWRRQRWDLIWVGFSLVFFLIMSAADRSETERYILPIMPCLWFLSIRAISALAQGRPWKWGISLAGVVILPLGTLIYDNYMFTKPDTRIVGKAWIETNVPPDATILMDGMRYRFVQSPPLIPNEVAVARRITRAEVAERLSRGVSNRTLALYAEAMAQAKGPKYDLHSTVWGAGVEDVTHYVNACFDYIIISSANTQRYKDQDSREHFPKTVQFYEQLPTDPRLQVVYALEPAPWQRQGPTITIYKVLPSAACQDS